jgi:inner membrane protein
MEDGVDQRFRGPAAGLIAVATVAIVDKLALPRMKRRAVLGPADELAHLATGWIVVAALPRRGRRLGPWALAMSVLLDLDHLPDGFGARWLRLRNTRPVPHSIFGVAVVAAAVARVRPGPVAARGTLLGLAAHLGRDLATGGTAVPLLWPVSARPFTIRYRTYAAALVAGAALGAIKQPRAS